MSFFSRLIEKFFPDKRVETQLERVEAALLEEERLAEIASLKEDKARLERELEAEKKRGVFPRIDVNLGDPSPVDSKERALYVAQVAGLHKEILEPKLKQMISNIHQLLGEATNDREYDQALKGALYFAWEFIRWGNMMVGEQIAIQTQTAPGSSEEPIN